jgi:hypothetical protein
VRVGSLGSRKGNRDDGWGPAHPTAARNERWHVPSNENRRRLNCGVEQSMGISRAVNQWESAINHISGENDWGFFDRQVDDSDNPQIEQVGDIAGLPSITNPQELRNDLAHSDFG